MKPWRQEERKPWCLERSQGAWKGGPETETLKQSPGDQKKESSCVYKEAWGPEKGSTGDQK